MEKLAIYGGDKVKTTPYGAGKRYGKAELRELETALAQNTLFYVSGKKGKEAVEKMKALYDVPYAVACSSGTAAIHVALGALGISAGDEVITTPVTDMGTVIGILAQNAVPVFADLDPHSYNLDPASVEKCVTDKTKAIIAVHLAGNPCDMDAIMEIAARHGLKVVEDCAQAHLAEYKGRKVGTVGDIGCFSFNEFKQLSAGDGGMVIMKDEDLFYKSHRFADKNYNRFGGEMRKIPFLAPNYRMNELTASVVSAQIDRAHEICDKFTAYGDGLTAGLSGIPGIAPTKVLPGCRSTYLWYMFRVDTDVLGVDLDTYVQALSAEGILAFKGYIPECVYEYDMFKNLQGYPGTHCPFDCPCYGKKAEYKKGIAPVAEEILRTGVRLLVNDFYTQSDLEETVRAVRKVTTWFAENKK